MTLKQKSITLTTGEKIVLDASKILYPEIALHPDSTFVERIIIEISKIWIPDREDSQNKVRQGSGIDQTHVDKLVSSITEYGIKLTEQPPAVIKKTTKSDGVTYDYVKGPKGDHRLMALEQLGITHWVFDVITLNEDNLWSAKDVGLLDNNHSPSKDTDKRTLETLLNNMLVEGRWNDVPSDKLVETLNQYPKAHCSSLHPTTRSWVITNVLRKHPEYTDTVEYSPEEAEKWVVKHTSYKHSGEYDKKIGACGWLVPEGYMDKRLYQLIRKFGLENRKSYMGFHTKTPKSGSTVNDKRQVSIDLIDELYECLDAVFEYKQKHGDYPFWVEYFIPADRAGGENMDKPVSTTMVQKNATLNSFLGIEKAA